MNFFKRQKTLDFYIKSGKTESNIPSSVISSTSVSNESSMTSVVHDDFCTNSTLQINSPSTSEKPYASTISYEDFIDCTNEYYDIGRYKEKSNITDFVKKRLLENPFCSPKNYVFPFSEHNKQGKVVKRYLNQSHLDKYSWLVYSPSMKGVYCKYCSLFAPNKVGENRCQIESGMLVSKPLTTFSKLLGKNGLLQKHQNNKYHINSVESAKLFLNLYDKPQLEIQNILSETRLAQINENRQRLLPIIDTIITLGKQNIAFRGHRDDGTLLDTSNTTSIANEGNFREILKLRIRAGDKILENHLKNASSNATYISKTTQNLLIKFCGEEIMHNIKSFLNYSKFYSILFDETTDISTISQMSVVIRYIYNSEVREDFIGFFDLHYINFGTELVASAEPKIDGIKLGRSVIHVLEMNNINVKDCIGICTDTCNVMTSQLRGAVSEIQKSANLAVRVPCYNHSLNLSLSKCLEGQFIRNCFGIMREVIAFFHASAKRSYVLKNILKSKLSKLCDTRWVERHDSSLYFEHNLCLIVDTLKNIRTWNDTISSTKAGLLINSMLTSQFLISLQCITYIFSKTIILSNMFQKKSLDLNLAGSYIKDLLNILKSNRENAEAEFSDIWKKTKNLSSILNIDLQIPRLVDNQKNRPNYSANTPEDYYRISTFIPMLDEVILDIKTRFDQNTTNAFKLYVLIPQYLVEMETADLNVALSELWSKYFSILIECNPLNSEICFKSEVTMWRAKWIRDNDNQLKSLQDVYAKCDEEIYPSCKTLLKILLCLPISVASNERSFSALRRLKTWLRNRMSEERLLGLALLHVNRDIEISKEAVLNRFATNNKRKLDILL